MTAVELLESLNLLDEHERIETKRASEPLCRLCDAGLLAQKGRGSATFYVPTDQLGTDGEGLPTNPSPEEETARRALLLHRNSRHVRNTYLRPLMRDGRLAMTNPDEPNDPQQAYRALEVRQ